jgi:hypothetical protein
MQPRQSEQKERSQKAAPRDGPAAGSADRLQIQASAYQLAVVSSEIAIELRDFDKRGKLVGHMEPPENQQASYKHLICPTG